MKPRVDTSETRTLGGGILIFDGDCGFCTSAAEWSQRRLPTDTRVVPWQFMGPELAGYGLTVDDARSAVYWIDRQGRAHRGHRAVAKILRSMGGGWRVVGILVEVPLLTWLAAGVYAMVARYRHKLPGGTPACRRDPPLPS